MGWWLVYFSGPRSCVGLGDWVLQGLQPGIKGARPTPKGGARCPPDWPGPGGACPNTRRSGAGTLGREGRKRRSLARGSCPAAPGSARRSRARLRVLRGALGGTAARQDTATSSSPACLRPTPTWRHLPPEEERPPHDVMVVPEGEAPADHDIQQHAQGPDGRRLLAVGAQADPLGRAVHACS